jgi:hypothetical protein
MSLEIPIANQGTNNPLEGKTEKKFNRYFFKENLAKTDIHANKVVEAYLANKG